MHSEQQFDNIDMQESNINEQFKQITQDSQLLQLQNTEHENNINVQTFNKPFVILLILSSALGGFLFGYDTGIVGGVNLQVNFQNQQVVTSFQKESIVSIAILGALIGSLIGGQLSDHYGRKITILISDFLFTLGSGIMFFCRDIQLLLVGRFIVGLGIGIAQMVVPVYIAELSPTQIRGQMVTFNNLFTTTAQFLAYFIALLCGKNWNLMLGLGAVPSFIQFFLILCMPESPRWLMKERRNVEAEKVMKMIINTQIKEGKQEYENEYQQLVNVVNNQQELSAGQQLKELFTTYSKVLAIGCGLQVFQQLSGINTVMYYGPEMIKQSKLFSNTENNTFILMAAVPLAFINFFGTVIAIFYIEKLGRKMIMLKTLPYCFAGMIMMSVGVYFTYFTETFQTVGTVVNLSGLVIYLLGFAIGLGATTWTINSEIYPLHVRGQGCSMSTSANWVANYAISALFLTLTDTDTGKVLTYLALAIFNALMFIFVRALVPETQGKTFQEIIQHIYPNDKDTHNHTVTDHIPSQTY